MNVIKAIYNFVAGDLIILIGVLISLGLLELISNVPALAALREVSGAILIIAILIILVITLSREAFSKKR